jgi:hypothetical protein
MISDTATQINEKSNKLNQMIKQREVYDPRIIDVDGSGKSLWSSESVELAVKGLSQGYKLRENPFLKSVKGALLRKSSLPFKYTEDEMEILGMCTDDKEFFSDNFGKLKDAGKGWVNITLRDYQRNLLKRYNDNRWNIIMFPRQMGKTTTTILEILHFCSFNIDKDCVVIAQSDKVVNEILAKIKEAFAGLPYFMQPGFVSFNKKGFVLDNGCRLSIGIASESVIQGFSLDLLYIDEFAYIKPSMVRKFWSNVYPSLVNNPFSRCIITSTPNGRNMFFELWKAAEMKTNKFIPYRIYWYDLPRAEGLEQFKNDTIANVSLEGWELGFECSFDTQLKSIFSSQTQKKLRAQQLEYESSWSMDNHYLGNKFNMEFISQDKVQFDLKKDFFLLGIDIAEGLEQDSTIAKLRKIEWDIKQKKLVYIPVAVFRNNEIAVEDFAPWLMDFSKEFDQNHVRFIVENNTYGGELFGQVKSLKLNDPNYRHFDNIIFAKFRRESKDDFEYGIRWNGANKKVAVKSFSNLVSDSTFVENHYLSVEEYLNFGKNKNNTYAAQYGHDDLVMSDVTTAHFIKCNNIYSNAFLNSTKEELRYIYNDEDEEILKAKEEKARKEASVYKLDGFQLRNHTDFVKEDHTDIYLMGMIQ